MTWLYQLGQDGGFALRMLRRMPGFTAAAILTLALGIGMTAAVFSVVNAVLLRPIGYPDPDRLVWLWTQEKQSPHSIGIVLGPDFVDWKTQAASFEHLVAYDLGDEPIIVDGHATQERVASVSEGFWELSGIRVAHGRLPAAGERNTLLVSQAFFEARLGGNPSAIGKPLTVDGQTVSVAGVVPRGFPVHLPWPGWPGFEPRDVAAYKTVRIEAPTGNMLQMLNVVGKLKPGVTIEQARAEIETIRGRRALENPRYPGNEMMLGIVPLSQKLSSGAGRALGVLLAAVAFLLLIACVNVASLLLGRATARQKELAIRAAVGASRARVSRQLLLESLMLALAGGVAGLLLARWSVSIIVALAPYAFPRLGESTIDGNVVAFTLAAAVVTAIVFGAGPAISLGRVNLADALKLGGKPSSTVYMTRRAGWLLVAAEVALAVVLLTGAGLLIKSFWRLNAHPPGFDPAQVLTLKVQFTPKYDDESRRRAYVEELLRRLQSTAGVTAAGISTHGDIRSVAIVDGAPPLPPEEMMQRWSILQTTVSEGAARALGVRVLRGRWLTDTEPSSNVVVNGSLARRDFPGQDPVGRRVRMDDENAPPSTIVGVVADMKFAQLDESPEPEVFVPYSRGTPGRFTAFVRTSGEPATVAPAIRASLADIDRTLPVFDIRTLDQALADSIGPRRFNLFLLGVFAAAAIALALIGVYGVTAYSVAQRTHEIGIRMALGAGRRDVATMILRQGAGMALAGVAAGAVAAAFLTQLMASLLYDVQPMDLPTFAAAAAGLALTALAVSAVPAFRAARIDPAETLR
jgi:putative ABC transport system permease protein